MLKRQIGLARRVTRWLLQDKRFEVLPVGGTEEERVAKTYMVVLFRIKDDEGMKTLVNKINDTGKMYVSGTVWDGRPAARIAISNWQVNVQEDGDLTEKVLDEVAA